MCRHARTAAPPPRPATCHAQAPGGGARQRHHCKIRVRRDVEQLRPRRRKHAVGRRERAAHALDRRGQRHARAQAPEAAEAEREEADAVKGLREEPVAALQQHRDMRREQHLQHLHHLQRADTSTGDSAARSLRAELCQVTGLANATGRRSEPEATQAAASAARPGHGWLWQPERPLLAIGESAYTARELSRLKKGKPSTAPP